MSSIFMSTFSVIGVEKTSKQLLAMVTRLEKRFFQRKFVNSVGGHSPTNSWSDILPVYDTDADWNFS